MQQTPKPSQSPQARLALLIIAAGVVLIVLALAGLLSGRNAAATLNGVVVYPTANADQANTALATVAPAATLPPVATLPPTVTPTVTVGATSVPSVPPATDAAALPTPTLAPAALPSAAATALTEAVHIVAYGDTLTSIAATYGVTLLELQTLNGIRDVDTIYIGQRLALPRRVLTTPPTPAADATAPAGGSGDAPDAQATTVAPSALIGRSAGGRPIELYSFGSGGVELVFVGALHGGYEWNTALLAWRAIDHFAANPDLMPPTMTVHIIPVANPDGLAAVTGSGGRFVPPAAGVDTKPGRVNANGVDLNRNWACNWQAEAEWLHGPISGGATPFSEPEAQALRDWLLARRERLAGVIFWHSKANLVAPGICGPPHEPSNLLAQHYSAGAGYPVRYFEAYEVTGDASDWLVTQGVASVAVELIASTGSEWNRNLPGMLAVIAAYQNGPGDEGIGD